MTITRTPLEDDVAELLILIPHLAYALERDAGSATDERVSGSSVAGLPINADVLVVAVAVAAEVPVLTAWACRVVAEQALTSVEVATQLRHLPRLHERMLATAATEQAARLALALARLRRRVKFALGLRTADRRLGQYCPLHDDPLRELVAPGGEAYLRYRALDAAGRPIAPVVDWQRPECTLCRHCGATWVSAQYLLLGRLLRQADARRVAAQAAAEGTGSSGGGVGDLTVGTDRSGRAGARSAASGSAADGASGAADPARHGTAGDG